MVTIAFRRAADWFIPIVGLARVQCLQPIAVRSLANSTTVGIFVTAARLSGNAIFVECL